ncbi:efflux RND transporter periplasmic adaptor subunit [Thalassotalea agariperforans]
MTRKKQILLPLVILVMGVSAFFVFSGMKKPPEEKPKVDNTPIVSVQAITLTPVSLDVESHGVVSPKYETELVAQVSGEIVELSEHFVRGGFVKKGDVLAKIDPTDYQAQLIDAQAKLASAKASLKQEIAHGKVAESEWQHIKNGTPTELSLRKPQLAKELSHVKAAEAGVLIAQRNLERSEIIAPYDAMIETRHVGLGSYISTGNKIGKVLATDVAEIRLPVAENQLRYLLNQGVTAKVTLTGNFAGEKTQWQARIIRSEGVIDSTSRMNYLVAQVVDPYGLKDNKKAIRFGAYVNAQISGKKVQDVAVIPRYLLSDNGVAVLDEDNKLRFVDVDIIRQDGRNVIVSKGLKEGDLMITSALNYPLNGMQLALAKPTEQHDDPVDQDVVTTELAQVKE